MKKRKHEEEPENMERWLVSYADFITLLFAFFVTMYAMSRVDERKLGSMVESMQRALGSVVVVHAAQKDIGVFEMGSRPIHVNISHFQGFQGSEEREGYGKIVGEIQKKMEEISAKENGKGGGKENGKEDGQETGKEDGRETGREDLGARELKFFIDDRGLVLRFSERFFFHSGDASIRPEVVPILGVLAQSLIKIPNQIRIEGHTDSVPINTIRFPSNWELSTARATSIVRYLQTQFQFDPNRLSAAGYGEFRPVASNKTPEGRMQNRRVDIVILSKKEMGKEPPAAGVASNRPM